MKAPEISRLRSVPFDANGSTLLSEGFNSWVYRTQDDWLIKVAKFPHSFEGMKHECRTLTALPHLSMVKIAEEYTLIEPCSALQHGGAYYRFIIGHPCRMISPQVEKDIASIMIEVHRQQIPNHITAIKMEPWEWSSFRSFLPTQTLGKIEALFQEHEPSKVSNFIHGDFWTENLMEQKGRIVGLIDWENACSGDVAADFAALSYLPESAGRTILNQYVEMGEQNGVGFPKRLTVFRFRRELLGLFHAIRFPESGELKDSIRKVIQLTNRVF